MRKGGLGALERLPPTILSILSNIIDKPTLKDVLVSFIYIDIKAYFLYNNHIRKRGLVWRKG